MLTAGVGKGFQNFVNFDSTKLHERPVFSPTMQTWLLQMDTNMVADQRFSLKQWFAGGAQSRGLRKPGCGHCYLRFFYGHGYACPYPQC